MDNITEVMKMLAEAIPFIIGLASIFIKVFPKLKPNNKILGIIKFIGKYIALNKTVLDSDRPK